MEKFVSLTLLIYVNGGWGCAGGKGVNNYDVGGDTGT